MKSILALTGASLLLTGCFGGCYPNPSPVAGRHGSPQEICWGTAEANHAMGTYTLPSGLLGPGGTGVYIGRW